MAEALIGPLVGRLQQLVASEARALVAVNDDIQRLRDKLMWLQAFLRAADAKRRAISDDATRVWLQQTRDAVFDAEDALDHFYHYLDMSSRFPWWARPCMRSVATFTTQVRMRRHLSGKINAINSRLEEIIQNKDRYKMEDLDKKTQETWKASTSITYTSKELDELEQRHLVLYKGEQETLEKALTEQELQNEGYRPVVVSVFGKSGTGKTTLVRDIYKKMDKRNCFQVQAMETFAPNLTATNILQQIVQQLTEDNENCPRSRVSEMLEDKLTDKKYLLVIDGEVSSTEWKHILSTLPVGAEGSRIVRITQQKPEEPPSNFPHVLIELKNLQEGDAIRLFSKRLLLHEQGIKNDASCPISLKLKRLLHMEVQQDFKKYSQDIYKITQGLPLAVVILSGLVQTKESPEEWEKVFDYLKSKKSRRLDSLLSLCFDDLPHELKCCFLYFAALPANTTIEERSLVNMWMAEGFLISKVGKTLEKVGYIYLNGLIARNLVNLVQMDDKSSAGSRFIAIQNKVHEYLLSEAHEASFLEVHSGDDVPTSTSARRLSLQNYTDKYAVLASPLPKLRSIFSQFEQEPKEDHEHKLKEKQACLWWSPQHRAISTEVHEHKLKEKQAYQWWSPQHRAISKEVHEHKLKEKQACLWWSPQHRVISKKMKDIRSHIQGLLRGSEFLRVINLQGIEIGEKLPDEIGSVVHLQYLGITSCSLKIIPQSIGRLTGLQTLDVRETSVRKLPPAFWMITTLRHVFGFALKLPKQIGNLKHLQTLDSIELDDVEQSLAETLGAMIHLENLLVWNISTGNVYALSTALGNLENLRNLMLNGDIIPSSVFITISLRRLKFLVLQGELKLSSELNDMDSCLPNLRMLSLKKTNVSRGFIRKLADLPSLATLALYTGSYKEEQLSFSSDGFRHLKKLKIDVGTLKTIKVDKGALPNLQEMDILSEKLQQVEINAEGRIKKIII